MSLNPSIKWNKKRTQVNSTMTRFTDRALYDIGVGISIVADKSANWIKDNKIKRNSATGTLWHKYTNEERGNEPGARVDSGALLNSVGSTGGVEVSRGVYESEFGIRLPSAGGRKYFMEQDEGFNLETWSGETKWVPGMQTFDAVKDALKKELRFQMASLGLVRGKSVGGGRTAPAEARGFSGGGDDAQKLIERQIGIRRYQSMGKVDAAREIRESIERGSIIKTYGSTQAFLNRNRRD